MAFSANGVERHPEYMSSIAAPILESVPEGSLVVMDEIGTLEDAEERFKAAVMRILSGNYRVLASVKAQNTRFLREVRRAEGCELYIITPENRNDLYELIKREHNI